MIWRSVRTAGWAPITVFVLHTVISATGTYRVYPALDIPMHLIGGIVIAYFFATLLAHATEAGRLGAPSRFAIALMVFTCTCAAAVFWEFAEWTYDRFFIPPDARGYEDTLLDMALGVLGGAGFVVVAALRRNRRAHT